jgi:hypothetical protein
MAAVKKALDEVVLVAGTNLEQSFFFNFDIYDETILLHDKINFRYL